jgi:predicted glutamine amidotransferase
VAAWGVLELERVPERAGLSEAWRGAVTETRTDAALLQLRQASPGMPHVTSNTHPFLGDGMAFAHNGHAHPTAALDALIVDAGAPIPIGDTDSERYFALVRAAAIGASPDTALLGVAHRIASVATATSLNALLLTPDALIAIAWWHEPVIRSAGDGETDRDYRLWYRIAEDRVVVASAFVRDDDPAWQELPHGHALHVERRTLRVRVTTAASARPAA